MKDQPAKGSTFLPFRPAGQAPHSALESTRLKPTLTLTLANFATLKLRLRYCGKQRGPSRSSPRNIPGGPCSESPIKPYFTLSMNVMH